MNKDEIITVLGHTFRLFEPEGGATGLKYYLCKVCELVCYYQSPDKIFHISAMSYTIYSNKILEITCNERTIQSIIE